VRICRWEFAVGNFRFRKISRQVTGDVFKHASRKSHQSS
jgi:hypothetical protein